MILENPNNFGNLSTEPYKPINILLLSDSGSHSKTKCTLLSWVLSCWVNYCLVQRTVDSNGSRMVMTVLCGSLVTRWMPPCLPHSLSPGSASGWQHSQIYSSLFQARVYFGYPGIWGAHMWTLDNGTWALQWNGSWFNFIASTALLRHSHCT